MRYRPFGLTGLEVSEISFGAGPVSGLMTAPGNTSAQLEAVRRAVQAGINWFDTAASYGDGQSESALGAALRAAGADHSTHVATKVRLKSAELDHIQEAVKASLRSSLRRLDRTRITLLQLHNSITRNRGDEPTSITPNDVLGRGGVLEAFVELQREGVIGHFGLTGLGHADALRAVIEGGPWAAVQLCVDILRAPPPLLEWCQTRGVAVVAIRVLAGGALAGQGPSAHTLTTRFFPLAVFEEDRQKAAALADRLPPEMSLKEAAVRFVLGLPVATALVGFASAEQVDEIMSYARRGPLPQKISVQIGRG